MKFHKETTNRNKTAGGFVLYYDIIQVNFII